MKPPPNTPTSIGVGGGPSSTGATVAVAVAAASGDARSSGFVGTSDLVFVVPPLASGVARSSGFDGTPGGGACFGVFGVAGPVGWRSSGSSAEAIEVAARRPKTNPAKSLGTREYFTQQPRSEE